MRKVLATAVLCLALLPGVASAGLVDGLLGYWPLDETSGATAGDQLGTYDGTISGNPTMGVPGKLGTAYDLDNSGDYITVSPGVPIGNNSFSLSFWLNRDGTGEDWAIGHSTGGNNNALHVGFRDHDTFAFAFWGNDLNVDNGMFNNTSDWMHFVCTYDSATRQQKVYANVVGGGSGTWTRTASTHFQGSGDFYIGKRKNDLGGLEFDGVIDEVGVWDRVLSAAEAEELYNGGDGLWFFSSGSITSAQDGYWHLASTWSGTPAPPDDLTDVTIDDHYRVDVAPGHTNVGYSLDIQSGRLTVETDATLTITNNVDAAGGILILDPGSTLQASTLDMNSYFRIEGNLQAGSLTVNDLSDIWPGAAISVSNALTVNAMFDTYMGTLDASTATVTLNSGYLGCGHDLTVANLHLNGGGLWLDGNTLTVADTLTVSTDWKLSPDSVQIPYVPTLTLAAGTFDYDPDMTVDVFNANGGDLDLGGHTLTVNNTFNLNSGITLEAAETMLTGGGGGGAIPTINLNGGTLNYDGGDVVGNTVNANGGDVNLHGNTLTVNNTLNVSGNTNIQSAETLLGLAGATVNLNSNTLTYDAPLTANNVTDNGGHINMNGNALDVTNNLTVRSNQWFDTTGPVNVGNAVVLDPGGRLDVSGDTVTVDGNVGGWGGMVILRGASASVDFTGGGIYNNLTMLNFIQAGTRTLDTPLIPTGSTVDTFSAGDGSVLNTGAGSAGRNFNVLNGTVNASHPINKAELLTTTNGILNLAAGGDVTRLDAAAGTVNTTGTVTIGDAYVHGTAQMNLGADLNISGSMSVANSSVHAGANRVSFAEGTSLVCGDHVYSAQTGSFQASGDLSLSGANTIILGGPGTVLAVTGPISSNAAQGVWYGTVGGNVNTSARNPGIASATVDADFSQTENNIAGNTTEIYTGWIYDADGHISFTEHQDDKGRLWLDGDYVSADPVTNGSLFLSDDAWNSRSYSGTGPLPNPIASNADIAVAPGWHSFELRISNGDGGSGRQGIPGFGVDVTGGSTYIHPSADSDLAMVFTTDPSQVTFGPAQVDILTGEGHIVGDLDVLYVLAPGTSAGTITMTGDLSLLPTSAYACQLGQEFIYDGTAFPDVSDFIEIDGQALLEGWLEVSGIGGYAFRGTRETYDVLYASDGIELGPGFRLSSDIFGFSYDIVPGPNDEGQILRLTQVPEPATLVLLGLGALGILRRRRRAC